ncbi:SDR family oxidoreductase [Alkalibacterium iburiense]|uniref:SDR family oxidoreductase n=1 Tax=Alkalibacterium iburiense TaxID=290589 RepID=A0ABN0X1L9_9LACT
MKLNNKVAVVTGGASGMGKAIVELFVKEGAKVVCTDYNFEGAQKVVDALNRDYPESAIAFEADVSDQAQNEAMIDKAIETFDQLDILVNNAGIMDGFEPVSRTEVERFKRVLEVNTHSVFYSMRKVIPIFEEQRHGVIVNNASIAGFVGAHAGVSYTASKHAVIGMTKNTGFSYANKNIRCNAIGTGGVNTNIASTMGEVDPEAYGYIEAGNTGNIRVAEPEEIARVALFLASDDSSFVNGSVLTADGGLTAY